ncbi:MAG: hypothetical protein Q7T61_00860 [Caulobacter sp.]|nr:hypothetical protein [Caulobacter sp.]
MGPISTGYAFACCGTLMVCMGAALVRTRALHLFGAAAFIFVMFWISRAVSIELDPPWSLAHYPLQDVILIAMLWATAGGRIEWWKAMVGLLLLAQLGFHTAYWGLYITGNADVSSLWQYIFLNNVGLAAILFSLSVEGARDVLGWAADLRRVNGVPDLGGAPGGARVAR